MKRCIPYCIAAIPLLATMAAQAQWSAVAPGIDYRVYHLDGPTEAYVARADRRQKNWTIDTAIGQGRARDGCETVPDMARRYDESVDFDGNLHDLKVTINGDYFNMKTCIPPSGQIRGGWFVRRFSDYSGGSGFVWTSERETFLGGDVRNTRKFQEVRFKDGAVMKLCGLNATRNADELVLYTPHWAERTHATADGVEVVVQVPRPVGAVAPAGGTIVDIRRNQESSWLPFEHVVLSAHGSAASQLIEHARRGDPIRFMLGIEDYGVDTIKPREWGTPMASLGGHFYCVIDGKVPAHRWEPKGKPGAVNRHPRTAVAFNDRYVYFVVVDGRSERSVGMTITELGRFCADHLDAAYAIAQDGGGSSTMWIDGEVRNVPSDGRLRPVANGYYMATVDRPKPADGCQAQEKPQTRTKSSLRLGPGTQYAPRDEIAPGTAVTIIPHRLNGVHAKGTHWWYCRAGDVEGWLAESDLGMSDRASTGQP